MSPITFVLPALAAFVLIGGWLILRAFSRVRAEPLLIGGAAVSPQAQPASAAVPHQLEGAADAARAERLAGTALDREAVNTLKSWYSGRECAVCRREIGPVLNSDPRPGLLNTASAAPEIVTWDQIPSKDLTAVLDSHLPVCPTCALASSFRRRFPDRVTDRTDTASRDRAYH